MSVIYNLVYSTTFS